MEKDKMARGQAAESRVFSVSGRVETWRQTHLTVSFTMQLVITKILCCHLTVSGVRACVCTCARVHVILVQLHCVLLKNKELTLTVTVWYSLSPFAYGFEVN